MPQPARAWGTPGHRLICEQAWDELQPAAERGVRAALGVTSKEDFAARCQHTEIKPHDLMSLPSGARDVNYERDCPDQRSCPAREIERAFADISALRGDVGEAILRLAHFTGEVHQPLSVGYAADRNGLDTRAVFLGRSTNMHAIWNDELVMAPRSPQAADTGFDLRVITNYLERPQWTQSTPLAWATESYWIMRTPATGYLGNPGDLAFDEVYVAQNKLTALEQIEKAGIRLSHLLNRAFGDPGASLPVSSRPVD
ncbi:MAG: S1/P1 nuclease [Proteobacteria bacterium]|nr:S1/P1 nuclease [Pseudomonadota bacterium]